MKNFYKHCLTAFFVVISGLPGTLLAESNSDNGANPSASAKLDFRITIPGVLRFQVGEAGTGNIDLIEFNLQATDVGNGAIGSTDITGSGGDQGGGAVTAALFSNAGDVIITETNNSGGAGLGNGFGDQIPYSEILASSGIPAFSPPTLSNAGGGTSTPMPNINAKITNYNTVWTYVYDHTADYPAGTYGDGAVATGGQVTYTAAIP
ncbi:MAG: hypothetical protein ABFS24_01770 [Pseudomonadota bacterium]